MVLNKLYNYPTLTRQEFDGVRYYQTPDGNLLPSVTTILSAVKDDTHLQQWVERVGHDKAEQIKRESTTLGAGMHQNLENYILGKPITGTFMEKALANLIIKKGFPRIKEVWGTEVMLYSAGLYAGTTDLVALLDNGLPAIVDFKNSLRLKELSWIEDYRAQLGAYALAHNEMHGTDIKQGLLMIATRDAVYQEFHFQGTDFDDCISLWLSKLDAYYASSKKNLSS